jgi:hypothetical protein
MGAFLELLSVVETAFFSTGHPLPTLSMFPVRLALRGTRPGASKVTSLGGDEAALVSHLSPDGASIGRSTNALEMVSIY